MSPPTGGPMTGPINAGTLTNDIARTKMGFRHGSQQDEPPDRYHQRAAHTLQDTRGNQGGQRVGHATSDRPHGEHDNRRAEDPARPKPVGGPAADRDEY